MIIIVIMLFSEVQIPEIDAIQYSNFKRLSKFFLVSVLSAQLSMQYKPQKLDRSVLIIHVHMHMHVSIKRRASTSLRMPMMIWSATEDIDQNKILCEFNTYETRASGQIKIPARTACDVDSKIIMHSLANKNWVVMCWTKAGIYFSI